MDRPTCSTCPYWGCNANFSEYAYSGAQCKRYPPTICSRFMEETDNDVDEWETRVYLSTLHPRTDESDFCGEHPDFPAWIESRKESPSA